MDHDGDSAHGWDGCYCCDGRPWAVGTVVGAPAKGSKLGAGSELLWWRRSKGDGGWRC